jgi:ribosomal-protein-alanine N-acetyltransferase
MAGNGVRIRPGEPADLPAIDRIERASFADPWSQPVLLQELLASALRWPIVVEWENAVAGYLMAWRSADQLHILNIAVDPRLRRRGLGAALLDAALAEARRCGLVEVTLEVRRGNLSALALYRRYGFTQVGERPGYYPDTGEDALILTLSLD